MGAVGDDPTTEVRDLEVLPAEPGETAPSARYDGYDLAAAIEGPSQQTDLAFEIIVGADRATDP